LKQLLLKSILKFFFFSQFALVVGEFESVEGTTKDGILVRAFTQLGMKEQVRVCPFSI
jgi:hypothetical protein